MTGKKDQRGRRKNERGEEKESPVVLAKKNERREGSNKDGG